jgi:hypothetical protein
MLMAHGSVTSQTQQAYGFWILTVVTQLTMHMQTCKISCKCVSVLCTEFMAAHIEVTCIYCMYFVLYVYGCFCKVWMFL